MPLKLKSSLQPMEALSVEEIPEGPAWQYEPKWDGFRCLAFRDGASVELRSKSGQTLGRYFPELVNAIGLIKQAHFVLDGEIVIPHGEALSFDELLLRIHPAESRIRKLAAESPALYIVFDLLADSSGESMTPLVLRERRKELERFARESFSKNGLIRLSPATTDSAVARRWLQSAGSSLDGVIAKRLDIEYRSGERTGMAKIKPIRTADCVVGGFRYASKQKVVGSLLLGLYDKAGLLHHVGFCSGLKAAERRELTEKLESIISPPGFTGRAPGGPSRWSTARSAEWQPLKAKLVVEVGYDHFTGGRFRHGTKLLRWRPDKNPRQCHMDQTDVPSGRSLRLLI